MSRRWTIGDAEPSELTSLDHTATHVNLSKQVAFQTAHAPSNAVLAERSVNGFFLARKGRTRFNFSFPLPKTLPSSCQFGRQAASRFLLRATAAIIYEGERTLLTTKKDVMVLERWDEHPDWWRPVKANVSDRVAFGGSGSLHMEACTEPAIFWRPLIDDDGRIHFDGRDEIIVRISVRNSTTRDASGVKLGILRKLELVGVAAPSITEVADEQSFRNVVFPAGSERQIELMTVVPASVWSSTRTTLFRVDTAVRVTLETGIIRSATPLALLTTVARTSSSICPSTSRIRSRSRTSPTVCRGCRLPMQRHSTHGQTIVSPRPSSHRPWTRPTSNSTRERSRLPLRSNGELPYCRHDRYLRLRRSQIVSSRPSRLAPRPTRPTLRSSVVSRLRRTRVRCDGSLRRCPFSR